MQHGHRRKPSRPPDRRRRLVPQQRDLVQPHARRRDPDLRGPAAALRRSGRAHPQPSQPGAALPPADRRAASRGRPTALGRRRQLQPDLPHTSHRPCRSRAARTQLKQLAARVFSQQLDRSKPLWELWLVQGLKRDSFAILTKTHHAMVDGVSGVDIGTVLFDLEPVPKPVEQRRTTGGRGPSRGPRPSSPGPRPISPRRRWKLAERAIEAVRNPETTARRIAGGPGGCG